MENTTINNVISVQSVSTPEDHIVADNAKVYALTDKVANLICERLPLAMMSSFDALQDGDPSKIYLRRVADEVIGLVLYEDCEHVWKGHKNPNTPDGPGEWVEYCDACGAEKRED
ncbi:MAG: hypothetical protein MOB07_31590 [Acidobacteria bacterium]|nr:hypothetical protein [Acidobacteriota bacterium]